MFSIQNKKQSWYRNQPKNIIALSLTKLNIDISLNPYFCPLSYTEEFRTQTNESILLAEITSLHLL